MTDLNVKKQFAYIDRDLQPIVDYCRGACWTTSQTQHAKKAIARYRKELWRVAKVAEKGWSKQRAVAEAVTLKSDAGMFICLLRMHMHRNPRPSFETVMEAASSLSVWTPTNEAVTVYWRKDSPTKFRMITEVGVHRGAQQLLLRDTLSLMSIDSEFDYTKKGAGGERAFVHEIKRSMMDGYRWWWTPDIVNCFPSMRPNHFKWLPVDKRLLKTVVFLPKCAKIKLPNPKDAATLAAQLKDKYPGLAPSAPSLSPIEIVGTITVGLTRQGLPQGSMLAPLLARAFIGRELREVVGGKELHTSTIMDDLCIGSCGAETLKRVAGAVTKRLETHPAGAIKLHATAPRNMKKGVCVIGYSIKHEGDHKSDPVHVKPGGKRIERYRRRLLERLQQVGGNRKGLDLLEVYSDLRNAALAYAWRWYNSNSAWTQKGPFSWNRLKEATDSYVFDFISGEPIGWDVMHAHGIIKQTSPTGSKL